MAIQISKYFQILEFGDLPGLGPQTNFRESIPKLLPNNVQLFDLFIE